MRFQGKEYRIVDLSRELTPGAEERRLEIRRGVIASDDTFMHEVDMMSHLGTHVEAPSHYQLDWPDIAQIPLESFIGRAVILDVSSPVLTAEVLKQADRGRTSEGDMVILRNHLAPEKAALTVDAGHWLVEKEVVLLGFDTSVSTGKDKQVNRDFHDVVMGKGICLLEVLANLDALTQTEVFFVCAPLRIKGLDSSPVRAFALEEVQG